MRRGWAGATNLSRAACVERLVEQDTDTCPECHLAIVGFLHAENHLVFEHSWARDVAQETLSILSRWRADERPRP